MFHVDASDTTRCPSHLSNLRLGEADCFPSGGEQHDIRVTCRQRNFDQLIILTQINRD